MIVVYHSDEGHIRCLAEAIADAARTHLPDVTLSSVQDVDVRCLPEFDAIVLGCPTRFGTISARMKEFLEGSLDIWVAGELQGRVGAAFTAGGGRCGDKMGTLRALHHWYFMHGMCVLGYPRSPLDRDNFLGLAAKNLSIERDRRFYEDQELERACEWGSYLGAAMARIPRLPMLTSTVSTP